MSHQRLVNTTPNPRATKNSRGELVGPLLPPCEGCDVSLAIPELVAVAVDEVVVDAIAVEVQRA